MNNIQSKNNKDKIIYTLRGPLNSTLKSKLKNKTSKLLNNSNISRVLSSLYITKDSSQETIELVNKIQTVKPDLNLPAVQLAYISNKLDTNIVSNPKEGTYIKIENKEKYFKNIGKSITFSNKSGYFLRKGVGSKLIYYVIKEMKEKGIKTIIVHPLNKELEQYYSKFGFKIISDIPTEIGRKQYYGTHIEGNIMILEL
jgi:predicted acetyltransferase